MELTRTVLSTQDQPAEASPAAHLSRGAAPPLLQDEAATRPPDPAPALGHGFQRNTQTYRQLVLGVFEASFKLKNAIRDIDPIVPAHARAQAWIDDAAAAITFWQPLLQANADTPLDSITRAQSERWNTELRETLNDVVAYKNSIAWQTLQSAKRSAADALAREEIQLPAWRESLRAAYGKGDEARLAQLGELVGHALHIETALHEFLEFSADLSIASWIRVQRNIPWDFELEEVKVPHEFWNWLKNINAVLSAANLLMQAAHAEGPTEMRTEFNEISLAAEGSAALTTIVSVKDIFQLAPFIEGYFTLYVAPMTEAIVERLNEVLGVEIHRRNIEAAGTGLMEVSSQLEHGGTPVYNFMRAVMRVNRPADVPMPDPKLVGEYFVSNREKIAIGTGSEVPVQGLPGWRSLDQADIQYWLFANRYILWAMFYGELPFKPSRAENK